MTSFQRTSISSHQMPVWGHPVPGNHPTEQARTDMSEMVYTHLHLSWHSITVCSCFDSLKLVWLSETVWTVCSCLDTLFWSKYAIYCAVLAPVKFYKLYLGPVVWFTQTAKILLVPISLCPFTSEIKCKLNKLLGLDLVWIRIWTHLGKRWYCHPEG